MFITPEEADRLVAPVELRMRYTVDGRLGVRAEYKIDKEGDWETMEQGFDRLPAILPTPVEFSVSRHGFHTGAGGRGDRAGRPRPYPHVHCRGLRQGVERDALVQDDDDRQGILEEHGEATRRGLHQSPCVVLQTRTPTTRRTRWRRRRRSSSRSASASSTASLALRRASSLPSSNAPA